MKKLITILTFSLSLACNTDIPDESHSQRIELANVNIKNQLQDFKASNNGRFNNTFEIENVYKYTNELDGYYIYIAENKNLPNEVLIFNLVNNEVSEPYLAKVSHLSSHIAIDLSDMNGYTGITVEILPDGSNKVLNHYLDDGSRVDSWFSRFDDCMGDIGAPFDSNTANWIFGGVASATTAGLWLAAVPTICATVATLTEDPKKGKK